MILSVLPVGGGGVAVPTLLAANTVDCPSDLASVDEGLFQVHLKNMILPDSEDISIII